MAASGRALLRFPLSFRKFVCTKLTPNFKEAVTIQTVQINETDVKPKQVLVKNHFVGINASDINFTAGRYHPDAKPPFDVGMEAIGEVVFAGNKCTKLSPGNYVAFQQSGSFAEYILLSESQAMQIPALKPEYLAFIISGTTASVSLENMGELKPNLNVLVTAAAGGTGQFAVQLAKVAGCHVIGTCSSDQKVEFLKSIGCHRPINYTKENLADVLRKEYPKGIDVVYESVGGDTFNTCVKNLAVGGRLIIIGLIASYQGESLKVLPSIPIQQILLTKSASLRGFFLPHFFGDVPRHLVKLAEMESAGDIKVAVDDGSRRPEGPFKGLPSVLDAVDFLYSKQNQGKIVVNLAENSKL
jgi:NADPH:quinone reductase-like Zn-dependent oxidoreductase